MNVKISMFTFKPKKKKNNYFEYLSFWCSEKKIKGVINLQVNEKKCSSEENN